MDPNETMQEAMFALHSGLRGRAEDILLRLVQEHPTHTQAWLTLGTLAAQSKRPDVALERLGKVLELDPEDAQALLGTGVMLGAKGRHSEALSYLERALQASPDNLQVLAPLAQCHYHLNQPRKAIQCFDKALKLRSGDPDLLYLRATCLANALRFKEAESDLIEALGKRPSAAGYALLGDIQQKFNRSADAFNTALKATRLDPKSTQALQLAAAALLTLGREEEAEAFWKKAEANTTARAPLLNRKAQAYMDLGMFSRAQEILNESIQVAPTRGETYYSMVSSKRITPADQPLVASIEVYANRPDVRDEDRLFFLYSLGKAKNDLGQYPSAIATFDEANALRLKLKGSAPFDRERFKAYFDRQIALYSREFIEAATTRGSQSNLPIFVLGMMRSGTSLMEQILSCHPDIGGAGEQSFWHDHEASLRSLDSDGLAFELLTILADEYLNLLKSASPGPAKVIDKNPANAMIAGLLTVAFPRAKIINMRRHPVDTALSIWMTPMRTTASFIGDRSDIVYAYRQYARLSEHWKKVIPADCYREVRYEDLTQRSRDTIQDTLAFCGVEWDHACLHPELNKRPVLTPSFWQVRQPLYQASNERWRNYLPWLQEFEELLPT